jgi:hypothetical protein
VWVGTLVFTYINFCAWKVRGEQERDLGASATMDGEF